LEGRGVAVKLVVDIDVGGARMEVRLILPKPCAGAALD
jgi:hypothetical protein